MRATICAFLLVACMICPIFGIAVLGESIENDSRHTAVALRVKFSMDVRISSHGNAFRSQEPSSGRAREFWFSDGSIRRGRLFQIEWSPSTARIVEYEWLREYEAQSIKTIADALELLPELDPFDTIPSYTLILSAINTIEHTLGLPSPVEYTNSVAYTALVAAASIPIEQRGMLNSLSRGYYLLGNGQWGIRSQEALEAGKVCGLKSLSLSPGFVDEEKRNGFAYALETVNDPAALLWTYNNWACYVMSDPLAALYSGAVAKLTLILERLACLDPASLGLLTNCDPRIQTPNCSSKPDLRVSWECEWRGNSADGVYVNIEVKVENIGTGESSGTSCWFGMEESMNWFHDQTDFREYDIPPNGWRRYTDSLWVPFGVWTKLVIIIQNDQGDYIREESRYFYAG
jgi:hypothetical protein